MVQPIQYQIPGVSPDPFAGVLQGLRLGATLQELDFARQDRARKEEELRLRQQQQLQQQQYLSDFVRRPNKTAQDFTEALLQVPSLKDQFTESWKIENTEQTNKSLSDMGRVFAALSQGKADTAYADLSQQAADLKAAGAPQERVDAVSKMAELARTNPEFLKSLTGTRLAAQGDRGKAIVDAALKLTAAEQGRMISTPADKIKAGLVNDKGAPLPGTFFQEPGKEPKLITGEKPQEEPPTIRTMRQLGFPITPEGYKQFTERGPAVQVSVGGEAKPTAFQEQLDKKFAPIAVDWLAGEKSLAASRVNQLDAVIKTLDSKKRITGPVLGLTPDIVLAFVNPASREARANAERVIQEGLRATLGAQFTRVEGEAFLARSYDPKAPQDDNARRLRAIVAQMKASAKDRDAMLKYVEGPGKGSLVGFTGRVPTIADFYAAIDEQPPTQTPAASPAASPAAPPGFGPRAVSGMVTPAEASPVSTPAVSTRALPNQAAIDFLRRNPSLRGAFDEKYGPGAAARVLGGQ